MTKHYQLLRLQAWWRDEDGRLSYLLDDDGERVWSRTLRVLPPASGSLEEGVTSLGDGMKQKLTS